MLLNLSIPSFILGQVLSHPCERECNGEPMTCYFQMITRAQHTDQHGRHADGVRRPVLTFNGVLPGPTLVVCEGDTVKVDLVNNIVDGPISNADGSTSTTPLFTSMASGRSAELIKKKRSLDPGQMECPMLPSALLNLIRPSITHSLQQEITLMPLQVHIGTIAMLELREPMVYKEL